MSHEEKELWKSSYIAALTSGADNKTAKDRADYALKHFRDFMFPTKNTEAHQMRK